MNKIEIIQELDCCKLTDYFNHISNLLITKKSRGYLYEYDYNEHDYISERNNFLKLIIDELGFEKEIYLCAISNLCPNTKLNKTYMSKISGLSNNFHSEQVKGFEFDNQIIKVNIVQLKTKSDIFDCFVYLLSGYSTMSFIFTQSICLEEVESDIFIQHLNRYNQLSAVKLDYDKLLNNFGQVYFTYGGFDFGEFIVSMF